MARATVTRGGRAMYSGILTLIILFTILYMVVSRAILRLNSGENQFKSFRAGFFEAGLR